MQHLFLIAHRVGDAEKHRFLCGHDEREWFAAAVPGTRGVSNVRTAIEALMPRSVRLEVQRRGVRRADLTRRKTAAYKRQGEWFFVPRPDAAPDPLTIYRNEPIRRGGGKPHVAQFAFRRGGELVYFNRRYPSGLTAEQHGQLIRSSPAAAKERWTTGIRDPELYVRGNIRHSDHATLHLGEWHLVQMNTENEAPSMRHLAFID